jgi:peptidoglycan/LPS O-acetylase OafA/YrhL
MTASTAEDRRFPTLNAVRAAAALGVVATHTAFDTGEVQRGAVGAVLSRLDFGVTLFFVLSGFLLSRPFFIAQARGLGRPSYRHFLWKRALRILPLYWVTVAAALLLLPQPDRSPRVWLTNLTLTQIYTEGLLPTGLTQMWSLCTEVAFYVLLPALCAVLLWRSTRSSWSPSRVLAALGLLSVGGFVWQTLAASTSDVTGQHFHQWLPGYFAWFAAGMAFALISAYGLTGWQGREYGPHRLLERAGSDLFGCWLLAGSVFALACTPLAGPRLLVIPTPGEALTKSVLYTVTAVFIVLPLVFGPEQEGVVRRVASSGPAVWLGDISYGIFCLHLLALDAAMAILDIEVFTGGFLEVFGTTLVITLILAALSYSLLERPFLRLKNLGPFATTAHTATDSASSPKA